MVGFLLINNNSFARNRNYLIELSVDYIQVLVHIFVSIISLRVKVIMNLVGNFILIKSVIIEID